MPTCQITSVTLWDPAARRVVGHVELEAAPASSIAELLQALPPGEGHRGASAPSWFVGEVPLDPRTTFADSPLTPGCHLSRGAPGPRPAHERAGAVGTLRAVRGPAAGASFRLRPGEYTVGRPPQATLPLPGDPEAARHRPVRVSVSPAGELTVAPGSSDDARRLAPGEDLLVGATTLIWSPRHEGRRAARREDGRLYFDRSFAPTPGIAPLVVRLPAGEQHVRAVWATVLTFMLPMLAAGALALLMHQVFFLLMAVLGPIGGVGHLLLERRQRQAREADVAARRAEAARQITGHVTREGELRRRAAPGVSEVMDLADGTSAGLWPRTVDSDDALVLRVGTADQPAQIQLDGEAWPLLPEPIVPQAPVTLDLRAAGVLSLVGAPAPTAAMARWLVLQLATLRSPEDLQLVLITADDGAAWEWVRWLPHLSGGDDGGSLQVGTTADTRLRRAAELRELVEQRRRRRDDAASGGVRFDDVVVVLIGALNLRELSGMKEVLRDGPGVGVYTLCTDVGSLHEARAQCRLEAATAIPGLSGGRGALSRVSVTRARSEAPIIALAEGCTPLQAEQVARALCPLRDRLLLATAGRAVPFPVRFTDLVDLPASFTPGHVLSLWRKESGPTTRVPLGADAEGVVYVDLARQGPHTMLGGATGAGKSILLQTFVTSLLLANAPDELNLVLVDFKGGSAFLPFERCPHVVSLIRSTGRTAAEVFDQAAAQRVLASVRTEVARRESILAPFGGEIDDYWTARHANGGESSSTLPAMPALPRLVVVFDEFARVLEVDGDFLKELVNVAAKGRSLGMHLVLATQSLQGKLSPELRNNITLRISLRQNEAADSVEVLDSPEAAGIPGRLRGRGLILCTTDEVRLPRTFQSGYLGGSARDQGPPPVSVRQVAWSVVGLPRAQVVESTSGPTDQDLVIAAIERAAQGFVAPFRPVLPPLADRIELAEIIGTAPGDTPSAVPFGVVDEPERQRQPRAVLDLAGTDRVLVCGGSQTGRTTFARTLITALAQRFRPDQVHLYVVERVPSGLAAWARLPQCGAVISAAEPDRVRRLVQWLAGEVERRRWVRLSDNGTGLAVGPPIVVVIDGWEVFENRADPAFVETSLLTTLREVIAVGVTVGVHVVAIGGPALASSKVAEQYQRRLVLPFPREEDRRACVASGTTLPPVLPGRAVDAATGHHVQLCLTEVSAEDLVTESLQAMSWTGSTVTPIPALPAHVDLTELKADTDGTPGSVVVGVGGPSVEPVSVQLFDEGPSVMMISGPPRSGRSTTLRTVLEGLVTVGIPVLLIASARSPLTDVAASGLVEVVRGPAVDDAALRCAAERLGARYAVLVDDVHQVSVKPTAQGFEDLPSLLEEIADEALGRRCLVMAGDGLAVLNRRRRGITPLVERAIESGHRLLLTPTRLQDAREHGLTLEADQLVAAPPGRGYLASGRSATLIQVAQAPADC